MPVSPSRAALRLFPWMFTATIALLAPLTAAQENVAEAIFDGQSLEGWHGNNPHTTNRAAEAERPEAIAAQQAEFLAHWRVEDGELVNDGHGPYATTDQEFGDIEMQLEYKTVAKADSGIYLRGTPQIQIWDTTEAGGKWDRHADKGSGALFNNTKGAPGQLPLLHADRAFGKWNHFRIIQIGARTWVELNHQPVVDGAIMENYWDKERAQPLPATGPIHLQTHGGEIRWRNITVRPIEIAEANLRLRGDDALQGFTPLFNGEDLSGWSGALDDYEVREGAIVCKPGRGGVLFTEDEFEDFVVRLEFKLPPGGNNGLAIRYPGQGSASYDGMCELQVLDNEAEKYAKLDPRQYHGSVYGVVAAHRGYLRPTGEWNYQEVTVQGSRIHVELNGTLIVDTDVSQVSEYKDDRPHPGIHRTQGHFGFAGHNDPVEFRNIAIKRLWKPISAVDSRADRRSNLSKSLIFHASFDDGFDANVSRGEGSIYTASTTKRDEVRPGNHIESATIASGKGISGDALSLKAKTEQVLFYSGEAIGYKRENWSGTVSMWLRLDPDKDLEPGFCDPIQLTERAWNDGAFFVDFDKELPRDFRLGVFPDFATWNPSNTKFEEIPVAQRPMVTVEQPPFNHQAWTHVCFTWKDVNAGETAASAKLYLNGELQGEIKRPLQITWNAERAAMMVGLNYIGLIDELKVFSRELAPEEIRSLGN